MPKTTILLNLTFLSVWLKRLSVSYTHLDVYKRQVLSKEEIKKILDATVTDLRFLCMFSILYSAGLRISELLEVKPGDINESRYLMRVRQGKGKKDRYTLLSKPLMNKLTEYNRLYKPKVWLFEHRPGEPFTEKMCIRDRYLDGSRQFGIEQFVVGRVGEVVREVVLLQHPAAEGQQA